MDAIALLGRALRPLIRERTPPRAPRRILLLKPCCFGDVVMTTPLAGALRLAWPDAAIDWAVSAWAREVAEGCPDVSGVIDLGPGDNPARGFGNLWRLAARLRRGGYDLLVGADRSPWLSLAAWLSRIPHRAGLDSAGRGFGYTIRVAITPGAIRHEAGIYLDLARALGIDAEGFWLKWEPPPEAAESVRTRLQRSGIAGRYAVIHPAGGVNPGMRFALKRWPAANFAAIGDRLVDERALTLILTGGPDDHDAAEAVRAALNVPAHDWTGALSKAEVGALGAGAAIYLGNDTGMTHLAAAAGGRVVAVFGPSDPRRYGIFAPPERARTVWRPAELPPEGVVAGVPDFAWARDGATVDEVWEHVIALLDQTL